MSRYDPTGTLSGAEYLASIYGTEKDKVNCSFYFKVSYLFDLFIWGRKCGFGMCPFGLKLFWDWLIPILPSFPPSLTKHRPQLQIGACRHGDKCSRAHHKPAFSNTVLLKNFYHSPVVDVRQADAFDSEF